MSILLHTCCGPCLAGSLDGLKKSFSNSHFVSFWYNPNIHGYLEYKNRFESYVKFVNLAKIDYIIHDNTYGLEIFLKSIDINNPNKFDRCKKCYYLRLSQTAKKASELSFEAFTTTLLISPYQNIEGIFEICEKISNQYKVPFLKLDLRDSFKQTFEAIKQYDLYKQKYCGCIFSEFERYNKSNKI